MLHPNALSTPFFLSHRIPATRRPLPPSTGSPQTLPVMTRMGIELNYSLWHRAQPGDATCSFRVQLS